MNQKHTTPTI